MTTNINQFKKNYTKRSLYSTISNSASDYRSDEKRRKSLIEIQQDEIQRIIRDDQKQYAFLKVFANPLIRQKKSFDLRNKVKFKILSLLFC